MSPTSPEPTVVDATVHVTSVPVADPTVVVPPTPPTTEPDPMPAAKPSFFVLGPSFGNHIEPVPGVVPVVAGTPGKRTVIFGVPPTSPGGNVNLILQPPLNPNDVLPINVYAFFVSPVSSVPIGDALTTDWFFNTSKAPSGSIHIGAADPTTGAFVLPVAGVAPSLEPYFVQVIFEFTGTN